MKGRFLLIPVLLLINGFAGYSQASRDPLIDSLFSRGEIYVAMQTARLKSAGRLPPGVGIDRVSGDSVFLYFHPSDTAFIRSHREFINLLIPPSEEDIPRMASNLDEVINGSAYPTWNQYLESMKYFRDTWPGICHTDTIGYSARGKLILATVINAGHHAAGEVPEIFYTSGIHGDEVTGFSLMLRLTAELLESHDSPETAGILDDKIVIINPLSNPDGTYRLSDTSIFGATRANAAFVDLNRNYPDPQNGNHPDGMDWQPENTAMMDYMDKEPPDLSANFHGGAEVFNYPFDTWSLRHADDEWFRFLGREYADTAKRISAIYMNDEENGITNGFDWYEVNGGRQDYVNWFLHGREVTIELSYDKMPPADDLDMYWELNRNSFLNYISQAGYGIEGHVRDAGTGLPVEATITIPGHDKLHSEVGSGPAGTFFRYLYEGNYDLAVSAEGYETDSVMAYVRNYEKTVVDVALEHSGISEGYRARTEPNPFTAGFSLIVNSENNDWLFTRIYDLRGTLLDERFFLMEPGTNKFEIYPHLPAPGVYILILSSDKFHDDLKLVKVL